MKKLLSLILALAMLLCLAACASVNGDQDSSADNASANNASSDDSNAANADDAAAEKLSIAYVTHNGANDFQASTIFYLDKLQAEYDYELTVLDGQGDVEKQSNCVANAVTQGVDGIIINPLDSNAIIPSLEAAKEAGVFVVDLCTAIPESARGSAYDVFVGCDDSVAAEVAANIMIDKLPAGSKIVMVGGPAGSDATNKRTDNFVNLIEASELELIDQKNCPSGWNADEAFAIMEDFLQKYDEIDGVWVHWDAAAVSVVQAIKDAGRMDEDMVIMSVDGASCGYDLVRNGDEYCCLAQPMEQMCIEAIKCVQGLVAGESYSEDVIVPFTEVTLDTVDDSQPWDAVQ